MFIYLSLFSEIAKPTSLKDCGTEVFRPHYINESDKRRQTNRRNENNC